MSILWGLFETFLDFLSISVEPQHRDKIPQLGLITLYLKKIFHDKKNSFGVFLEYNSHTRFIHESIDTT